MLGGECFDGWFGFEIIRFRSKKCLVFNENLDWRFEKKVFDIFVQSTYKKVHLFKFYMI